MMAHLRGVVHGGEEVVEVQHKQIDLMKAEMALPGSEVANIVKVRERFGG